ncbi:MAG TPA: carboxypeptidase-like regulatory domain-containing protein [Armatimonadota bacterium]|nr:carboxypeptidase-like regulatory domain-containing protein [Armatimonadota bacterium]
MSRPMPRLQLSRSTLISGGIVAAGAAVLAAVNALAPAPDAWKQEYQRLTPQPITGTTFTDPTARPGQTYRYVLTAVDRSGNESAPTAPVEVTVAASGPAASPNVPITEASGAPVPGVRILAVQKGSRSYGTYSCQDGHWLIDQLPAGTWVITAGKKGFYADPSSITLTLTEPRTVTGFDARFRMVAVPVPATGAVPQ